MEHQPEIVYRGIPQSDSLDFEINKKVSKLERYFDHIQSIRVIVEDAHKHSHKGHIYHIGIEIHVPGKALVVNKPKENNKAHEDAKVAIRDAFQAAERQLQDYAQKLRGKVKHHEPREEAAEESFEETD